jgi:hypothetical protein
MKYIQVNTNNVKPIQADWRDTSFRLRDKLMNLAYVKKNPQKEHDALEWLECLCKVHPYILANTFIEQASGLGSQEMRALVMHDKDKYFPSLSANEIYQSKRLEAFPVHETSSDKGVDDGWIKSAVRDVLLEKTGGHRNIEAESRMLTGNEWLKSRPTIFYSTATNHFITDIEINKGAAISEDSEMRLHYHNIVAKAAGVGSENNVMLRANLAANHEQLVLLRQMAAISPECKLKANELLVELIRDTASGIDIDIAVVDVNPTLVSSLIQTGSKHWDVITNDVQIPLVKIDKPLPAAISDQYTLLSKEMVVAQKTSQAAKNIADQKRSQIMNMVTEEGLTQSTQPPNDLTHLREGKVLDKQRLFDDLVQLGVPRNSLMKREVDRDLLLSIYDKAQGGSIDVSSSIKFKGIDIDKLRASAKVQDIEIQEYQSTSLTPYLSGQTRGPVFDKIQEITQMIGDRTSASISSLSSSQMLDHKDLTTSLKNTGVSKQMTTTQYQEF